MDLQSRGTSWVGNMYHKFEAMCQEVDDFVSKDTVKYVENQVQTVGESMKKFYSEVVQDFLPPVVDPVKPRAQAVALEQSDSFGTHIKSMMGITEESTWADKKQTCGEGDAVNELNNKGQFISQSSADSSKEENLDTPLEGEDEDTICKNVGEEDNVLVVEDLMSSQNSSKQKHNLEPHMIQLEPDVCQNVEPILMDGKHTFAEQDTLSELDSCRQITSPSSAAFPEESEIYFHWGVDGDGMPCEKTTMGIEENKENNLPIAEDNNSSDSSVTAEENSLPVVEDSRSMENNSSFDSSLPSTGEDWNSDAAICTKYGMAIEGISVKTAQLVDGHLESDDRAERKLVNEAQPVEDNTILFGAKYFPKSCLLLSNERDTMAQRSSITSVSDVGPRGIQEDRTGCIRFSERAEHVSHFSSTVPLSKFAFSNVFHDQKLAEMEITSSKTSAGQNTSKEHKNLFGNTDSLGASCISSHLSSSSSSPTLACNSEVVSTVPAFSSYDLPSEINDICAITAHQSVGMTGSSGNEYEFCCDCSQLMALMSSLQTDPGMETIDLSDRSNEGKLEGSCIVVDHKLAYASPSRSGKFRSYKKLIQDAFASRKRLIKEYKQLAVLYGDIDAESSQNHEQVLPSVPVACLHSKKSTTCSMCESGWELL